MDLKEMTSNIFYIVAFGVGFKCPRKIHLITQGGGQKWQFLLTFSTENRITWGEGVKKA